MSGNNALGDSPNAGGQIIQTVQANESISAGDAVALDQTAGDNRYPEAVQLDNADGNEDQVAAVATEDINNSDTGSVQVGGFIIANVASGISKGERLGSGSTPGRYASEDGAPHVAWSNEGGQDQTGTELGTNEAEVYLG